MTSIADYPSARSPFIRRLATIQIIPVSIFDVNGRISIEFLFLLLRSPRRQIDFAIIIASSKIFSRCSCAQGEALSLLVRACLVWPRSPPPSPRPVIIYCDSRLRHLARRFHHKPRGPSHALRRESQTAMATVRPQGSTSEGQSPGSPRRSSANTPPPPLLQQQQQTT